MAAKKKNILSEIFIKDLADIAEGIFPAEKFDPLVHLFESEASKHFWTTSSEANLHRILTSLYDKIAFLFDCLKYPHHAEIVVTIAANSNYLTDIVVRNPEYLYQIFNPAYLDNKIPEEDIFNEIDSSLQKFKSLRSKVNFLKNFKRRILLKIGLNDFQGTFGVEDITYNLSIVATAINRELFQICYEETLSKNNIQNSEGKYCLCSLGKLGGNELNYSSDVDLILFFESNFEIEGTGGKEFYEILSDATLLFIKLSTDITDKGYVYRVDFRLRPDGRNAPICMSLANYLRYYETRGEDWERQMLIKLNFIGGCKNLYHQFSDYLTSFIYPSSFNVPPTEQIKRMKANIEKRLSGEENIKLIPGGIRDIEFSLQALQLMNGGKHKSLRTGNSLVAIRELLKLNLLSEKEAEVYTKEYIFYRRIEHYLQLMNDRQTHVIPESGELLEKLAVYLGFKDVSSFNSALDLSRRDVRKIYESIVGEKGNPKVSNNNFSAISFIDPNRAKKNIEYLRTGTGLLKQKEFDAKSIKLFSEIEPALIKFLKGSFDPDKVLENFSKIIGNVKFVSIWYAELRSNAFLTSVLSVCERSQRAIDLLTGNKSLNELLVTRKVFLKDLDFTEFSTTQVLFILAVQKAVGIIDHSIFSEILTEYLADKLKLINLGNKFPFKYFIGGLGSFGSHEMNFASDIDLIVVADDVVNNPDIQDIFQNYLAEARQQLAPFEVDFRLRPEGKNSPLVWDIESYNKYLNKRARVWEFQSLIKLNFIEGDKTLFEKFKMGVVNNLITDEKIISSELKGIAKKLQSQGFKNIQGDFNIKKNRGGILSIDFIIHKILLSDSKFYEDNFAKGMIEKINYLIHSEKNYDELSELIPVYNFYKNLELTVQNNFAVNKSSVPTDTNKRKALSILMNEDVSKKIIEQRKKVNLLFKKYLGK